MVNRNQKLIVILMAFAISFLLFFGSDSSTFQGGERVICDASITGTYSADARFESISCDNTGKSCTTSFKNLNPFSILGIQKGEVEFETSDDKEVASFDFIEIFGDTKVRAKLCTGDKKVKATIIDEDGTILDSKIVRTT